MTKLRLEWSKGPDHLLSRSGHRSVSVGNQIYQLGGKEKFKVLNIFDSWIIFNFLKWWFLSIKNWKLQDAYYINLKIFGKRKLIELAFIWSCEDMCVFVCKLGWFHTSRSSCPLVATMTECKNVRPTGQASLDTTSSRHNDGFSLRILLRNRRNHRHRLELVPTWKKWTPRKMNR